jgi:hypothetical protein
VPRTELRGLIRDTMNERVAERQETRYLVVSAERRRWC